jgi:hypothetical protein
MPNIGHFRIFLGSKKGVSGLLNWLRALRACLVRDKVSPGGANSASPIWEVRAIRETGVQINSE